MEQQSGSTWVGAVIVAALLATACGGGAAPAAAPTTPAATSPAPVAPAPSSAAPAVPASPAVVASAAASPAASPVAQGPSTSAPGNLITIQATYPQISASVEASYVAEDQGFFARNGLDVTLTQLAGPAQVAALGANNIQVGLLGANELGNADASGSDLVGIATSSDLPVFSLYANPKYATVQDLAGQTIGITGPGSSTDVTARVFLKYFNLTDQVAISPAGGSQPGILAAILQGAVAAGILTPPTTAQAEAQGLKELVNGVALGIPMNMNLVAVTHTYLRTQPDAVRRFLTAYQQAWTFCGDPANEPAVTASLIRFTQATPADAKVGYDAMRVVYSSKKIPAISPDAVEPVLALSDNPQARAMDPSALIDNSLINEIGGQLTQ